MKDYAKWRSPVDYDDKKISFSDGGEDFFLRCFLDRSKGHMFFLNENMRTTSFQAKSQDGAPTASVHHLRASLGGPVPGRLSTNTSRCVSGNKNVCYLEMP